MLVETKAAFLEVLDKSRLLSASQMDAARILSEQEPDPVSMARSLIRDGVLNRWQAYHLLKGRYALSLGKYKFLDQIEVGGQHRMYLAEHPQLGRKVAIKTLSRRQALQSPDAANRFLAQARKLGSLEHRSILRVYDVDVVDERCFLVMECVQGRTLQDRLADQTPLATEMAAEYTAVVAAALAYAHQQDVAHGNLCPANLILDELDQLKIANLGLSGLTAALEEDSAAEVHPRAAQQEYLAPEVATGLTAPGPQSDIYSLGAVLFALLTGGPPKRATGGASLPEERPDLPGELTQICQRMLAVDPPARYASAGEVAEALEPWIGGASRAKAAALAVTVPELAFESAPQAAPPGPAEGATAPALAKAAPAEPKAESAKPAKSPPLRGTQKAAAPAPQLPVTPSTGPSTEGALAGVAIDVRAKRPRARAAKGAAAEATPRTRLAKPAYLIGGGLAALVLLLAAALLLMFWSGSGDQASPEASGTAVAAAADSTDQPPPSTPPADAMDPEDDPLPEESDPVLPAAAQTGDAAAAAAMETPPAAGGQAAGSPDSQPGSTTAAGGSAPAPKTAGDAPGGIADAGEPRTGSTVAVPAASGAAAPAAAATATSEAPVAAETPAAAETPTAAEPAPAAASAGPQKTPFADLSSALTLPPLDTDEALKPVVLGRIYAGEERCFVRLRGGENAGKGEQIFTMRNADSGLARRDWEILFRDGGAGSESKIAHLSLGAQAELSFQWQPAATASPAAGHLINCVLSFACRGESHLAALRQPVRVPAMSVNLQETAAKQDWSLEQPPDLSALRMEILGLGGPKFSAEPQPPVINADRGEAWVKLEDGGGLLSLKIETSLKRDFQVTVTPHARFAEGDRPERLNVRKLQQLRQQVSFAANQAKAFVAEFKVAKDRAPPDKKRAMEQQLQNMEAELKRLEEAASTFERFDQLLKDAKPQLSFRVFYAGDGSDVTILQVGG